MRKVCLDTTYELAKKDPRVVFIGSDLGVGTLDGFKKEFPDRFIMEGVSEAHVVGMGAGLALEGKIVYINTIATFLSRRCFEQIVLDACLHQANVRLLANGGGVVYAPLGPTHLAIDDIGILRTIPGMTIIAPADAPEMRHMMLQTLDFQGPLYVRFGRGGDPLCTDPEHLVQIGKASVYRKWAEGSQHDVLLITTGITLFHAQEAAAKLASQGLKTVIAHCPTVKPLDSKTLLPLMKESRSILTIEEHTIIGGLGGAVSELISENLYSHPKPFKRIGLPDEFPHGYGRQGDMMARAKITSDEIVIQALALLGKR